MRQCLHHGIPKHEITKIFYDGLGAPDIYLLDAASGGTFMRKYEDEALELIELVAKNSHHHAAKSFGGRSAPAKGRMLDAKAVEIGMLLDKIENIFSHIFLSFLLIKYYFCFLETLIQPKFDQVNSAIKVNRVLCGSTRSLHYN